MTTVSEQEQEQEQKEIKEKEKEEEDEDIENFDKLIHIYSKGDIIDFNKINLNDWNPNFVSSTIMNAIKDDIIKNGFLEVIVLQKHNKKLKKDYVIINGEHRYQALLQLWKDGYKLISKDSKTGKEKKVFGIPSTVIDVNDKTAKALTIRLNREHGDLMPDKVGAIIRDISPNVDIEYINDMLFLPETEILVLTDLAETVQDYTFKVKRDLDTKREQAQKNREGGGDEEERKKLDSVGEFLNRDDKATISTQKTTVCPKCGNNFLISSS